ncbi:MAG: energy transducer TonB [Candidatus Eremiobacteraeota bacterium]|nr:energy transducer TonB [Candidatus Eremiobacteraeota bacterium]
MIGRTYCRCGKPSAARIYRSSGDPNVDHAVLAAAEKSKYSPKLANCTPVQGTYLFRADFAPYCRGVALRTKITDNH